MNIDGCINVKLCNSNFIIQNVEIDCQWGMPKDQVIYINKTEKSIQREYYMRFVSDRWIVPERMELNMHNMTLLWADVPEWLKTVSVMVLWQFRVGLLGERFR